jgi:PKD repeat protein
MVQTSLGRDIQMKYILILITSVALLLVLGSIPVALAQGPDDPGEPPSGGMPGHPAPAKPIPHHEPGQLSRAGSYRTQVERENELGALEVVEISGVDAMAADGVDPLVGNYTLVDYEEILFSVSDINSQYGVQMSSALSSPQQKADTLQKFAPKIWLALDSDTEIERWPPLTVTTAFTGLKRSLIGGQYWVETKDPLDPENPRLTQTWAYCATPKCVQTRVATDTAPVYAFWVEKEGNGVTFVDLVYFVYFPYNRGKKAFDTVWENHVGDWEHVTVRLTSNWNGQDPTTLVPERIYLSAHSFGYEYAWASFDKEGYHPIVYSAWGSHGMWKDPGTHCYDKVAWYDLCDVTNATFEWNTWNNVQAFDFNAKQGIPGGSAWPVWMRDDYSTPCANPGCDPSQPASGPIFRWGNPKGACYDFPFVGEYCQLTDGPTGPIAKPALSSDPFSEFSPVIDGFHLQSFQLISTTFDFIPDSRFLIGSYKRNDITAGDLNGDGQAEQIAAWLGPYNHVYLSVGELPGSARTTSAPGAVAHPDGSLDLAVRGYDDALWHQRYDGSNWGEWRNGAGGFLLSGPAIVAQESGQSASFVIGADNQVYRTGLKRKRALQFDGVDDYVEAPPLQERSVSMWTKPNVPEQVGLFDGGTPSTDHAYVIGIYGPDGIGGGSTFDTTYGVFLGFGGNDVCVPFDEIQSGWHHIAISWDGDKQVRVGLDGTFPAGYVWNGSNWTGSTSQPFTLPRTPSPDPAQPTWLGRTRSDVWGVGSQYFDGIMDEVAVFDRALSEADISTIYQSGWDSMSGKVLGLHMDDTRAVHQTILTEASGDAILATLVTNDGEDKSIINWQAVEPTGDWSPVAAWQGSTPELPAPAVVARGNQLDLFRLGPDNTLRWQHSDDGSTWGDWQSLGGMLGSGPGAVSWGPDHMQVFARGVDEALWHRTYDGSWGPWQRLELDGMDQGVTIASAQTAVSPGSGQIRVYVRGSDDMPYWVDYTAGSWGSWQKGGGNWRLASGVAAVWQTDHYELFAQKADGKLQHSSDGLYWDEWTGLPPRGPYIDTGLIGDPFPLAPWGDHYDFSVDVETGHFSGDGRQQIVLAYHTTDKAALAVGDWTSAGFNRFHVYDFPDWQCTDPARFVRVTTGNYDGEGRDEVGVVLACGTVNNAQEIKEYRVQILKVDPPPDSTSGYEIGSYCAGCKSGPFGHPFTTNRLINTIIVKSGDFDAPPPDTQVNGIVADELVVGSSWWLDGQGDLWDHGQMYQIFKLENKTALTFSSTVNETAFTFNGGAHDFYGFPDGRCHQGFDLAVGNVDDDPADEFVTLYSEPYAYYDIGKRSLLVYDFQKGGDVLSVADWKVNDGTFTGYTPGLPYILLNRQAYRDRLVVADLDHDLVDEVGYLFNHSYHTSDWGNTFLLHIYQLHETDPSNWYAPPEANSLVLTYPNADYYNPHLVAGDFTGNSLRVGRPSYRVQNRVDSLVAVINVPPKHRDYVKVDDGGGNYHYELFEVLTEPCTPTAGDPNCTHAKHAKEFFEESSTETKNKRDWAIGGGLDSKIDTSGAFVDLSLKYSYGENFQHSQGTIQSSSFTQQASAYINDKIVYFGTPYWVWEYPVFATAGSEQPVDYFTVIFPIPRYINDEQVTRAADTTTADYPAEPWYRARHQTYNVWSYAPQGEVDFPDFDPNQVILDIQNQGGGSGFAFSEENTSVFHQSTTKSHDFSSEVGAGYEGGFKLFGLGFKAKIRAYVKGSYAQADIQTETQTASEATDISAYIASQSSAEAFTTRLLGYRAKDGYLVLDYQTDIPGAGNWLYYYSSPDPAFILPWSGFPYGDNPVPPTFGLELFSPEIQIVPGSASVSETVTISATVRNFSNVAASNVKVRFCRGDPGSACDPPAGEAYIGEDTIGTIERIDGPQTASIQWQAAGVGKQRIYAVIDPDNTIDPEVHDEDDLINNNVAYGLIKIGAAAIVDQGLVSELPYQSLSYDQEGSGLVAADQGNPWLVAAYVPPGNLSEVVYFELQDAALVVPGADGKPFELVAYEGDEFRENPNYDFPLKPGNSDPPAVIALAQSDVNVANLKLYRALDDMGTNWTEATCPGYQIQRFPDENLILVPVCQAGIFVFSSTAPGPALAPVAEFSAQPLSGAAPLTVNFTDQSTNFPTSWLWDFGDGDTSTSQHPSHIYDPGIYTVTLTISNTAGSDTETKPGYVTATGLMAKFSATPVKGTVPLTVTFSDDSRAVGVPTLTGWDWDFGDGGTATAQNPVHTYVQTGTFTVTLTVSNSVGSHTKVDVNCITVSQAGQDVYLPVILKNQP